MQYISTRGETPASNFDDVLLSGLAPDGGLFVPENWPQLSAEEVAALQGLPYPELALRVLKPFVGGTVPDAALAGIIDGAYEHFDTPEIAPLKQIGDNEWLLELFHGPTLAFKDMALQVLGPLFDHVLKTRGEKVAIIGATSGDTGSAAIEACRDRDAIEIFMLHPKGRVTEVQRLQMTTVPSANVYNIAIEGTFDDCQDLVKAMFNDQEMRDRLRLSAVNSINWARIMSQVVYYFWAGLKLGAPETHLSFAVPTGNFGNVFAGYEARAMGLPIDQLVIGSNSNDILTRFLETGTMEMTGVTPTISPSMDIQVSSNFERLLFDLVGRDGHKVTSILDGFRDKGKYSVNAKTLGTAQAIFYGARFDDDETKAIIKDVYDNADELIDPHTAVGIAAARTQRRDRSVPMIALATAHPAKFPDAVEAATGVRPQLPAHLADLFEREERCTVLPNDFEAVSTFVSEQARGGAKA